MSLLEEIHTILESLTIAAETGGYSETPPAEYVVLSPLSEEVVLFADDEPQLETHEVRISVFSKQNYRQTVKRIVAAFLVANIDIVEQRYVSYGQSPHA